MRMTNKYKTLGVLLFAFIGLNGVAQQAKVNHVNALDFQNAMASEKGTLLDVRTESEFANGHLPNAGQLNYYALDFQSKLLLLPQEEPIYLYCNTGWRSKWAAETLVKNGYARVYNLKQGIMEWELRNLPVLAEAGAKPQHKDKMDVSEFRQLVNSEDLVFIDYYAPWCGPCRQMMPMIDRLQSEWAAKVTIVKINADASKKLIKEKQLLSVPYFELYKNGARIFNHSGLITRDEIIELLDKNQ